MRHPFFIHSQAALRLTLATLLVLLLGWENFDPHLSSAGIRGGSTVDAAGGPILEAGDDVVHPYGRIKSKGPERDRASAVSVEHPLSESSPLGSPVGRVFRVDPRFVVAPVRAPPS